MKRNATTQIRKQGTNEAAMWCKSLATGMVLAVTMTVVPMRADAVALSEAFRTRSQWTPNGHIFKVSRAGSETITGCGTFSTGDTPMWLGYISYDTFTGYSRLGIFSVRTSESVTYIVFCNCSPTSRVVTVYNHQAQADTTGASVNWRRTTLQSRQCLGRNTQFSTYGVRTVIVKSK